MDWMNLRSKFAQIFKKYRYPILILAIGIFLMTLPEKQESTPDIEEKVESESENTLSQSLELILSQIEGVGKVSVMLTEEEGSQVLYQTDSDTRSSESGDTRQEKTVLITGADRTESGLIRQELPPRYRGALIVCQGADRSTVKLAVVEAVANVTGISADRITVLKMK